MVSGYFLAEFFGFPLAGQRYEVPFNIMQIAVGGAVGIPIAILLRKRLPKHGETKKRNKMMPQLKSRISQRITMKLPPGKIPIDILKEVVFKNLGAERSEVVLGPAAGVDGAVLDVGGKNAIVSMDPITGAVERIGWEAININANDVATFGVEPAFFFSCIMLPEAQTAKSWKPSAAK